MSAPDTAGSWGGHRLGSAAAVGMGTCRVMPSVLAALVIGTSPPAGAIALPSVERDFAQLAAACAPNVDVEVLRGLVRTESSWNPYAIGVVGGRLVRQPASRQEAVATARALAARGYNFSMGLAQVNRANLAAYGESIETVLEPCRNLRVGGAILARCDQRARQRFADRASARRAALSCYYSGSFERGQRPEAPGGTSYVERVLANTDVASTAAPITVVPAGPPAPPSSVTAGGGRAVEGGAAQSGRAPRGVTAGRQERPAWVVFVDDGVAPAGGPGRDGAARAAAQESAPAVPATSDVSLVRVVP